MNKTKLSWTVSNIEKMHKGKMTLSFEHPIQRKSEIWNNNQKSLLIHSMLANYPVPNIYVLREDSQEVDEKNKSIFNYYVMDGKQRLTSVLSYMWGEFPLDDDIPNIIIEDVEYEIGGKYFVDLDDAVQYEIKKYKFDIISFEDCSDIEVEEIFYRLNNSTPLSKSQVAKSKIGVSLAKMLNELLSMKFFTTSCNFSKKQLQASDDQRALIQSMMLLDTNNIPDFELKDFSENSILEYSESIHDTYSDKQCNILKSAIQYLSDAFPEKNKQLRKISIPMLIYLADVAEDAEIKPMFFRQWWEYFTEEDEETFNLYKTYCSTGSTKLEKIKGRLSVTTRSFCTYCEIEVPEELKEMVEEVNLSMSEEQTSDIEEKDSIIEDAPKLPEEEIVNPETETAEEGTEILEQNPEENASSVEEGNLSESEEQTSCIEEKDNITLDTGEQTDAEEENPVFEEETFSDNADNFNEEGFSSSDNAENL